MIKLIWVALTAIGILLNSFDSEARSLNFYLAKDKNWNSQEHISLMKEYGIPGATVYYNLLSTENRQNHFVWVRDNYLDRGYKVILALKFEGEKKQTNHLGLLQQVIDGDFDDEIDKLIVEIIRAGKPIVIRPFHELDGSWHPWGIYAKGNSPELAVAAVRHVVNKFSEVRKKGLVTIEINFNRRDGKGKVLGEAEKYIPEIAKMVDAFSISTYNRCGTSPNYRPSKDSNRTLSDFDFSFSDEFRPVYKKLSKFTKKPINVAETSTSGLCGGRISWFSEMLLDIKKEFPKVESVTFFFGNVAPGEVSNDVPIQWGFNSEKQRKEFKDLIDKYQFNEITKNVDSNNNLIVRYPWNVHGQMYGLFSEADNLSINSVTGEKFGKEKLVFRGTFTQRALLNIGKGLDIGPSVWLGTVQSTNDNMWWNNQVFTGVSFGLYGKLFFDKISWGGWSIELFAEQQKYTVNVPDCYSNDVENRIGVRTGLNFGGDWSN